MTSVASNSHAVLRSGEGLQQQFSREDAPAKPTEYTFLQLINMVRDSPILYDEELQASIPDSQLKVQKREVWDRIRKDIVWQDTSLIQDAWADILEQYAMKSPELTDTLIEALRWTDPLIKKKKFDSRPPSRLNPMSSALDNDFYADVPLSEDVLEPGQSIGGGTSPSTKFDYVVIQPSVGHVRANSHQSIPPNPAQFSRKRTPSPRATEAIVRSYPLSPKRINHRMQSTQERRNPNQLNEVKKEVNHGYGRSGVLVEVEPSPSYSNTKIYKMISTHRNSASQRNVAVTKIQMPHRTTSLGYEAMPEQMMEASTSGSPPKKKIALEMPIYRGSSIVNPSSSNISKHHRDSSLQNSRIITEVVPMADDEIILEAEPECKLGPSGLLMDPNIPSTSRQHEMDQSMGQTADDSMHHYHNEIEENVVVEEEIEQIEQQPIANNGHDLTTQYDEDLAFQQHINSVLNRLPDDDKALLKFNMQKIILDARFGAGAARNLLLKEDEMIVVEDHVEANPGHVESEEQPI
uniref:MADF domain-containing protein n=1 Tax=Caenorhabditis tropicalis TaxID=1561998 RepID=A0A1I7TIV3_9PELO